MKPRPSETLASPHRRWSPARARRGEVNAKTVVIIVISLIGVLMLLACGGLVALGLFGYRQAAVGGGQSAQRMHSRNNLAQIGLALHNYHDVHHQFPPSGIYGEDGTAYHSWQSMLLPYIDQASLYSQIDMDRPWDDPVNSGLFASILPVYQHPSIADSAPGPFAVSHYAGNSQVFRPNGNIGISDITDGTSNTMLAGEVAAGFKPWGDPSNVRDPAAGLAIGPDTFSGPVGHNGTQILMSDGAVRFLDQNVSQQVLDAIATPDAGEVVPQF